MTDLRRVLQDLVDDPAVQHPVEDAPGVLARARRRRRTHAASAAAVSLVTVGALAVGGAALARTWQPPLPADTPTPVPTTTTAVTSPPPTSVPAPTTTAAALPPGDPTAAPGSCGWEATAPDGDGDLRVAPLVDTVGEGDPVPVWVHLVASVVEDAPSLPTSLALVLDGVAVAVAPVAWPDDGAWTDLNAGTRLPAVVCDDGSGAVDAGAPVPGGTYGLLAVGTGEDGRVVVADGGPVVVAGPATARPAPTVDRAPDLPTIDGMPYLCDDPWPPVPRGDLSLRLTSEPVGDSTQVPEIEGVVEYTGPGTLRATTTPFLEVALLRDGVVVGATLSGGSDAGLQRVLQPPGLPWRVATGLGNPPWSTTTCDGGAPAPGTYEIVAYTVVVRPEVSTPGGEIVAPGSDLSVPLVLLSTDPVEVRIG